LPDKYLLFVGRFIETKGIKEMMEAYRDLVQKEGMNELGLVLLGEGRLQSYIENFSKTNNLDNVFIEGFVEQDKIQYYYANASAFILMSLSDPNPLVVFEAMATGIPIICSSRAGNATDFIIDGENGCSVDPYKHNDSVEKIKMVLTKINADRVKELSTKLLEKANYDASSDAFIGSIRSASSRHI
jgi:glycosyltransferase involved in cell wall biosynthesis